MRGHRMKRLIRELAGRSHADFVETLNEQLTACLEGARVAHLLSRGAIAPADARDQMIDIEHRGDEKRGALVEQLSRSIVTPIDREDLFRISRSIDDVLDNLRDYVREFDLLNPGGDRGQLTELTAAVIETIESLVVAVTHLVDTRHEVGKLVLAAKKSGGDIRQMYQRAIATLLDQDPMAVDESVQSLMKKRELLRRLDVVGLRLGEAADALADGVIKRSY